MRAFVKFMHRTRDAAAELYARYQRRQFDDEKQHGESDESIEYRLAPLQFLTEDYSHHRREPRIHPQIETLFLLGRLPVWRYYRIESVHPEIKRIYRRRHMRLRRVPHDWPEGGVPQSGYKPS